ncbi:alpha/beta hydrolase [Parvibaculum sp.]|jgi:pimeloyl-ACP methyl ester carboxylesterase|uniref:alpha/beta fold hydrolase n=1 Tax=Parvibaculum sp. TaxID=2024848 RepID=UPI000C608925|nr:alpha/beta hydrolase [Parvibaculum sp.]HAC58126.1 alpha/beta hydrolase [Rhodobiaceae bacterium]MAU59125.1 alpha/beta hydrolase [Parvibaculum sp.]MBO6669382.1 alpha/beta hydrolase [Parvibaculum sp.]MBO6692785.1 alpha/beta hydrolase [Parvibaculum sp.]MBO6715083.1 alpha/beta hydrolase [Parvibaculum sp.]|tara:strand:- start:8005 stop:8877 length:873 start_codon:yes stop_codon:yes gene_type:complete
MSSSYRDLFYTSQDGLKLYARDYGERTAPGTPVICLPGLTRNSKDFEPLAGHLSDQRRVLCPDLRGRGRSDYCDNWADYTPVHEMMDTLDLMGAAGIGQAVFVGTSRGGLIMMALAAFRPNVIKASILNDIGPEVDPKGIARIAGYVGVMETPQTWDEAAVKLRMMNEREFPNLSAEDWRTFARRTFAEEHGAPKIDYDTKIGTAMRKGLEASKGEIPTLWPQFKSLSQMPLLAIRGENSDILTAEIMARMADANPAMKSVVVKDRGHAPFLDEPEALGAIDDFLASGNL